MARPTSPRQAAAKLTEFCSPRVIAEVDDAYVKVAKLKEGEMFVVPKGVRHNPVADEECHILLIERKSTLHTGDVVTEKTRSIAQQLRPV